MDEKELKNGDFFLSNREEDLKNPLKVNLEIKKIVPKKTEYAEEWIIMFQDAMETLAYCDLQGKELKLFMYLLSKMGMKNQCIINQTELAKNEKIDMTQPRISQTIKKLVELGFLIKGEKIGNTYTYEISPSICWKGTIAQGMYKKRHLTLVHSSD